MKWLPIIYKLIVNSAVKCSCEWLSYCQLLVWFIANSKIGINDRWVNQYYWIYWFLWCIDWIIIVRDRSVRASYCNVGFAIRTVGDWSVPAGRGGRRGPIARLSHSRIRSRLAGLSQITWRSRHPPGLLSPSKGYSRTHLTLYEFWVQSSNRK